jgi:predicted hotdog family 3-hydroxylacyl-ACP dehydratase
VKAFALDIAGFATWKSQPGQELPACAQIPPLLRRRFSALSRIVAHLGTEALRGQGMEPSRPNLVLASRHGEIDVLSKILDQIHAASPVSPTQFSSSVHHTSLAHFSLAFANRQPARAVSAGAQTWEAGWLEAFCMAQAHPADPVLLIFAEDIFPDGFPGLDEFHKTQASGCAFLLLPEGTDSRALGKICLESPIPGAAEFSQEAVEGWLAHPARGSLAGAGASATFRLDPIYPDVVDLLPHKPPMVLLDRVVMVEFSRAATSVKIRPGIPFFREGGVSSLAGIEYMAQTVAILSGWSDRGKGLPPKLGFLLSVREYDSELAVFPDGANLRVEVSHSWGEGEMMRFEGTIVDVDTSREIAHAVLNVFGPEKPEAFLENA